jgi:hypothetical protein
MLEPRRHIGEHAAQDGFDRVELGLTASSRRSVVTEWSVMTMRLCPTRHRSKSRTVYVLRPALLARSAFELSRKSVGAVGLGLGLDDFGIHDRGGIAAMN